jgi:hypothetical protein
MDLTGGPFWFLMGVVFVVVAAGFYAFARDRGWVVTWWKALLAIIWYGVLCTSFFAWGTLIGENEAAAGFKLFLIGLFVSIVFGVGLIRLMAHSAR